MLNKTQISYTMLSGFTKSNLKCLDLSMMEVA